MTIIHPINLGGLTEQLDKLMFSQSKRIHTEKWQGFDIKNLPEAEMHELTDLFLQTAMYSEDLDTYRSMIKPNLPWADDHFYERICGDPVNPGNTWRTWPWALKADQSRVFEGRFSHTYMERYWPRFTGKNVQGGFEVEMKGHWFRYGDLGDLIELLAREPYTRQAYLPIFFPEDTGAVHGNRVPCTLGYHWMVRDGRLNVFYPIRSCDYYRHFRDDIYLTIRLTLWLLDSLREKEWDEREDPLFWEKIVPGHFSMWIGSLHMFRNDYIQVFGGGQQ